MSESNFGESQAQFKATETKPMTKPAVKPTGNPLIHWLGAFVSVGVLGVMVYWGLQLVQRDPNEVPVIKAMEGPARVLPEDPGGTKSSYTGLAVNSVQSEGEAEKPSDRVVLAPAPRNLLPEDVPVAGLTEDSAESEGQPVAELILDSIEDAISDGLSGDPQEQDTIAKLIELEDRKDDGGPITLTVRDVPEGMRVDTSGSEVRLVNEDETEASEDVAEAQAPSGTKYAPAVSLLPKSRNNSVRLARASAPATTTAPKPLSREVPEASLGTRLIQLGAYDSRETALQEWVRISSKHHDLLGNKNFLVQFVETGGRKFYRLRAVGFADSTESKSMCSALIQRGAQCIPVVAR
jgi:hypothetical protein